MEFESEIQELVYEILTGDAILSTYLGGDVIGERIGLSLSNTEAQKISVAKPAYIVVETMSAPAPVYLRNGIDQWTERYCQHVFTKPENRDLRAAIEGRLRELLHRKSFTTDRFIVYDVSEYGREGVMTETGLFDYRFVVSLQFLPKND